MTICEEKLCQGYTQVQDLRIKKVKDDLRYHVLSRFTCTGTRSESEARPQLLFQNIDDGNRQFLGSPSFGVIYEDRPIHRRWRRYIAPYGSPGRIETPIWVCVFPGKIGARDGIVPENNKKPEQATPCMARSSYVILLKKNYGHEGERGSKAHH
jgi:hypothetical protein